MKRLWVRCWRAYQIIYCTGFGEGCRKGWCLAGMMGLHLHGLPAPTAVCGTKQVIDIPEHSEAPNSRCACGYYGLLVPDIGRTLQSHPCAWMRVEARGKTILAEEGNVVVGCRMERFHAFDVFWPPARPQLAILNFQELTAEGTWVTSPATPIATLIEALPEAIAQLGIPLRKEPMQSYLEWGEWGYVGD